MVFVWRSINCYYIIIILNAGNIETPDDPDDVVSCVVEFRFGKYPNDFLWYGRRSYSTQFRIYYFFLEQNTIIHKTPWSTAIQELSYCIY